MLNNTELYEKLAVVVIAASAGGLSALKVIITMLPENFPGSIAIVQHLHPVYPSRLAEIFHRYSTLDINQAKEGDRLQAGRIFFAPPDRHLEVNSDGCLSLTNTGLVHFVRPSADKLFESAAACYKDHTIAVVLTGMGFDGSNGVRSVKQSGGMVIAQDKHTSKFFGMPDAAIRTGSVDYILPITEIAPVLINITHEMGQAD
jgi:two-component system chemotaxis response regulator CheB